jgi:hypothetical protein
MISIPCSIECISFAICKVKFLNSESINCQYLLDILNKLTENIPRRVPINERLFQDIKGYSSPLLKMSNEIKNAFNINDKTEGKEIIPTETAIAQKGESYIILYSSLKLDYVTYTQEYPDTHVGLYPNVI